MKRRYLLLALLMVGAVVVSYLLKEVIYQTVFVPLAYLWWLFGLYYRAVPQLILWILLVVMVFVSSLKLVPIINFFPAVEKKIKNETVGPVEQLSMMLNKPSRGVYYKWMIANRLGRVAREMLDQREGRMFKGYSRLRGRDWTPPADVDEYLETGLNGSFADYPTPHWWREAEPTPLDLDPQKAIDYLENEMEMNRDRNRKSI